MQPVTKTYYSAGGLVAMREITSGGNALYFLHSDHLGSTSLTTNNTGGEVARQSYFPYGQIRTSTGSMPTDIGFTGQRARDSSLGSLMFYQARYYSPVLGRFISADTIVPEPGNPQGLNRFAYTYNNPLRFTDVTGHCASEESEHCTHQDELRDYLLELLGKRDAGEFDDLRLMELFLQRSFNLHRDPLDALYAATRVVRREVRDTIPIINWDLGFGYDTPSDYFYEFAAPELKLNDTGFGELRDRQANQLSHFIGEAYISLYTLRGGGGQVGGQILNFGNELLNEVTGGTQWNQADIDLGLIANQFATDIWNSKDPAQALTIAVSSIRSFHRPIYELGPGPDLWP